MNKPFFWYLVTDIRKKNSWLRNFSALKENCGFVIRDTEIAKIDPELWKVLQQKKNISLAIYFTDKKNLKKSFPLCFKTKIYSASFVQRKLKKTEYAGFSLSIGNSDKSNTRDLLEQLNEYFLFKSRFPKNNTALELESLRIVKTINHIMPLINLGFRNFIIKLNSENIRFAKACNSYFEIEKCSAKKTNTDLMSVWRAQIDVLDQMLIDILKQRLQIVDEMGQIKRQSNQPFFDAERWQEILLSRKKIAKESGLDEKFIEKIFDVIHLYNLRFMLSQTE